MDFYWFMYSMAVYEEHNPFLGSMKFEAQRDVFLYYTLISTVSRSDGQHTMFQTIIKNDVFPKQSRKREHLQYM